MKSSRLKIASKSAAVATAKPGSVAAGSGSGLEAAVEEYLARQPLPKPRSDGVALDQHLSGVAQILDALALGPECVAAIQLSPFVEADLAGIRNRFGTEVADLAEAVSRMDAIRALGSAAAGGRPAEHEVQLERLRKMLLAMVQDVRVVVIKLADHLQELRERVRLDDAKLRRESAELARDLFAPLANRLGIWQLKWELEDLAFRVLEPATYQTIARLLDEKRADRERYIEGVVAVLKDELARTGITADVAGRPKHIYSIYRKIRGKRLDFEQLYDVRAVRIVVEDIKDCYAALGLVHHVWSPIPKEFDDYIAKPKSNSYRSLHTAVIGPEGKALEVQIRTREMHQHSELGVAAHWRYKEGGHHDRRYEEKISWLRQILEWKDEVRDAGDLAEQFRVGLFDDTVYVLTPQGKVIDLPQGATPIDFAYHVHTELGHRCRGAKVDGVMVPLNTALKNGQRIEITAAKQGGPSRDWLNPERGFLRSPGARSKVRQWFNRQNLDHDIATGRVLVDKELQRQGATDLNLDRLAAGQGYDKLADFLADVGRNDIRPKQLKEAIRSLIAPVETVSPQEALPQRRAAAAGKGGVLVVGVDKLLTVSARCCKPAPPEPIVGFVTRGRGVSVHRADCANVRRLDADRLVAAAWGASDGATFPVDVAIEAVDRTGLLRDISEVLSRERINVIATQTQSTDLAARMRFTLEVTGLDQLKRALALVREVRGVTRAARR